MQRIFKPLENKQDLKDLFDLLPDWVNWITKDKNSIKIFQDKPYFNKYNIWQTDKNENDIIKHIDINFQSIAYTRCIIQRPINYQDWIGKWGIFGYCENDLNLKAGIIGVLRSCTEECWKRDALDRFCMERDSEHYNYFRLLTQEEKQNIMEN